MQKTVAGIVIPDSKIAVEAQEILREYGNDLLWNHSNRVYLFGALQGKKLILSMTKSYYMLALYSMILDLQRNLVVQTNVLK